MISEMKPKQLLASDFDGTLYRHHIIPEETRQAIAAWRQQGNLFGICSGRQQQDTKTMMEQMSSLLDFLIICNGAAAYNAEGRLLFATAFPEPAIEPLFQLALDFENATVFTCPADGIMRYYRPECPAETTLSRETLSQLSGILQISVRFEKSADPAARFAAEVQRRFPQLAAHQNGRSVDVTHAAADKGAGVAAAAARFQIPPHCCHTIGDNRNDLPMLTRFDSAVIEDGDPEALARISHPVPSVEAYLYALMTRS